MITRTHTERLTLAVEHCSTCPHFRDHARVTRIGCRLLSSCRSLWMMLGRRLFGCPKGEFGPDIDIKALDAAYRKT